ncbi:hypothetical protein LTR78_005943 [Recurvomyces mirabilis]|uniref:Uncharacterized protein n=1 Tax=Recurvomyces mirabilis TaxID=574656 RepID=A0AAE1C0R3_9PEZI|nr:hypothetical protein LTR78_005943 [Recurvomyces mirabilis]KAK5155247.1 hypothetical protein LTS14_006202 [Recurvomyces mirabilis]
MSSQAGGFILSPPASSTYSTPSTTSPTSLPHPRTTPLKAGSSKESTFIRYVDQQILHIQRRFAKRTSPLPPSTSQDHDDAASKHRPNGDNAFGNTWATDTQGYKSMKHACKDIEDVIGVVWVSGTPSLQIPYLVSIALLLSLVVSGMLPSPRTLFKCLGKLDHCFASLIQGQDIETGERLPGFFGYKGVSDTEKVRIRSLVERTRVGVIEVFKKGEFDMDEGDEDVKQSEEEDDDDDMDLDGELVLENPSSNVDDDEDDSHDMQLARVYDHTIQELGGSLEGPSIGVLTERRG